MSDKAPKKPQLAPGDDLVAELRRFSVDWDQIAPIAPERYNAELMFLAADEIERLRSQLAKKEPPVTSVSDPSFHMPSYELGYQEGESRADADWILQLDELPFEVTRPYDVVKAFRQLSGKE